MQIFYKAFSTIIYEITAAIISLIGYLISFVAWLADYFIKLNLAVTEDRIVTLGWTITRDLANLGFVLVIIIIAIATILRIEKYGAQQLLLKLVAAAIIVNFSLTIAGFILNFSNVLTNFFLTNAFPEGAKLGTGLAGAFNPQQYYPTTISAGEILTVLISPLFSVIFILILLMVMIIFLVAIIYRYVVLAFLLILAPLAWLFWIFPALSSYFQKWWHKFFQWTFFLPAMAFFIYLPIKAIELAPSAFSPSEDVGALTQLMQSAGQMIILIGLLIGGLMIASQTGIAGAAGAMKLVKGAGQWATNKTKQSGATLGRRALSGRQKTDEKTGETTSWAQRAATGATKIPVLGRAFRGLPARVGGIIKGADEEDYKKEEKRLSKGTKADTVGAGNVVTKGTSAGNAAAVLNKIAKDNTADQLDIEKFKTLLEKTQSINKLEETVEPLLNSLAGKLAEAAKEGKPTENLEKQLSALIQLADKAKSKKLGENLKINPHLAGLKTDDKNKVEEKIAEIVKGLTNEDITKVNANAFKNEIVVKNLSENHVQRITQRGSIKHKEALLETGKIVWPNNDERWQFVNTPNFQGARQKIIPDTEENLRKAKE